MGFQQILYVTITYLLLGFVMVRVRVELSAGAGEVVEKEGGEVGVVVVTGSRACPLALAVFPTRPAPEVYGSCLRGVEGVFDPVHL